MARISFSALIEEIIGKLGGSVFQDSYGGLQIRTRVSPRNPQTQYQQLRRGEFGYLSGSWRNLTSVQRQTFIDAASTPPAALNLFLKSNINLTLIEEPTIVTYIPSADPGSMTVEFVDASPESMLIRATGGTTVVPAGTKLLVQVTFLKAPTKIFTNPSMYSPVISFDEGTDLSIPTDILSEWQTRYGVLVPDKRVCLKANLIDKTNGLRGADSVSCTITEAMAQKYIPLFTKISTTSNVGAGMTALQTITIAANTLSANSQKLLAEWEFQLAGGAATKVIQLTVDGNTWTFNNINTSANTNLSLWLLRTGAATARGVYKLEVDGHTEEIASVDLAGMDFTAPFDILIEGQGTGSNQVNLLASWLDHVKEP